MMTIPNPNEQIRRAMAACEDLIRLVLSPDCPDDRAAHLMDVLRNQILQHFIGDDDKTVSRDKTHGMATALLLLNTLDVAVRVSRGSSPEGSPEG